MSILFLLAPEVLGSELSPVLAHWQWPDSPNYLELRYAAPSVFWDSWLIMPLSQFLNDLYSVSTMAPPVAQLMESHSLRP